MENQTAIDRVRALFHKHDATGQDYEPLDADTDYDDEEVRRPVFILPDDTKTEEPYSRVEYYIFLMLGVSQLWAWYV